jgi:HAD superfamily phosphatase (TIGR01668 family)
MAITTPTRRVRAVSDIDLDALETQGVRAILIDRDNTCVPRDAKTAPAAVQAWLDDARERGMEVCLVSNNFHTSHVERSARELGVEKVDHTMKPAPFAGWAALDKLGVPREQAVLVGDQVFTDVVAGSLAGVETILVDPQSTTDLWYTHIFRIFERLALKNVPYDEG